MNTRILLLLAILMLPVTGQAQRKTDKLDRGLVAVPSGSGNLVSWKIFGEEYYDVTYNLYCNNSPIATGLQVSNFLHTGGDENSEYQVEAVVRGIPQDKSAKQKRWNNGYFDIPVAAVTDRDGNTVTDQYILNDISLGDVDGDGIVEFIVKRNYSGDDIRNGSNKKLFHHYECYNLKGERLWWIDLGPNMMAGPDEQWDLVMFDWDQDGKAEGIMRGADNMIIHTATGKTINIGNMSYVAPRDEYTNQGAEYLLYLNGATGEPYGWDGTSTSYTPQAYPLPRFEVGEAVDPLNATAQEYINAWGAGSGSGKDTGHRSSKHYFAAPYLDGFHPSIFLGRGCYTQHKMVALDVDPATHALTERWRWANNGGWSDPWFGNGFHNFGIADVDWDGRDEIVFGSMIIDDNGKGLCTTGLGHGDAQHCADFDPYRHGQEKFNCNEDEPACTYWNATTGKFYYRYTGGGDDGRSLCGNFSNTYPGSMGRTTNTGMVSAVADRIIPEITFGDAQGDGLFWSHLNNRIYWDGDFLDEVLDSPGTERDAAVWKPFAGRQFTSSGCKMNNDSKNNPGALADIFGDWREEIVVRTADNKYIRIYTTTHATEHRLYTLWHDHQYRNAMVWQPVGYNQPPHKSFFLGELEGITIAPPPLTTVGRTEVPNGSTIGANLNDQHILIDEAANTTITVSEGAAPYIATFNVPSWIQGTNSNIINDKAETIDTYYSCDVKGAAFTGKMRLVKQGDGILNLPAVEQTYTGNTDIWAGTLNFDGKLLNSTLWLNRFAELNSDGGLFRHIKMDYASILRPGGADKRGTITTDSLTLGFGSRLILDAYTEGTASDVLKVRVLTIENKKDWKYGPQYLFPVAEFNCHKAEGAEALATGKYLVAEGVEKVNGDLSDIIIEGISTSVSSRLLQEDDKIYLQIRAIREPGSIIWNGNENSRWDLSVSENFTLATDPTVTNEVFTTGDKVLFDATASRTSIEMRGELQADSVIIDGNKSYTFSGSAGSIVNNTVLVKRGTGMLTINNDNSFTGGTRISGGIVSVKSLANENMEKGNLGGVTNVARLFVIENGAELRTTAPVTQGSPMSMQSEEGGIINNSNDFFVNKPISGTVLTKKGNGWMKLNVGNTLLNRFVLAGGTLQLINNNKPATTLELRSGTVLESWGSEYAINVPKGGNGVQDMSAGCTYANALTGEGTIRMICKQTYGSSGGGWWATRAPIKGNWSAFEGTVIAEGSSNDGRNPDPNPRFTLDASTGLPKGTLQIADGTTVLNTGKTFAIGRVSGDKGKLGGYVAYSNNGGSGANTWKIGNDNDWIWGGTVTANSILVKTGSGKVTLNGASDHSGSTTVEAGELHIGSSAKLGTGALTVKRGAIFSGATTTPLSNSKYEFNGGSTLQVGATVNSTVGYMQFGDKDVLLATGSTLDLGVKGAATASTTGCTYLSGINKLTLNGNIRLHYASNLNLQEGDSIVLWKNVQSVIGTPTLITKKIGGGLYWDDTDLKKGILRVTTTVPEGITGVQADTEVKVAVINAAGTLVTTFSTTYAAIEQTFVENNLPRGIYILRITAAEGTEVRKLRK